MAAIQSKKVFITQSVFFAFIDRAHPSHTMAEAYFRHFGENGYQLYTDTATLMACYDALRIHMSVTVAKEFLRAVLYGNIEVIRSQESEERDAVKLLSSNQSASYTYQNALVAVQSYRRNISQIATFHTYTPSFGQVLFTLPF